MTTLLLDTQAMLWFFWDDPQLSAAAKAAIEMASNRKLGQRRQLLRGCDQGGSRKTRLGGIEPHFSAA